MKVLFLMKVQESLYYFKNIIDLLKQKGCEVKIGVHDAPPQYDTSFDFIEGSWGDLQFAPIHEFSPDVIIIWNGFKEWQYAATSILKIKYKVFHAENAWFPQGQYIYISSDIGSKSSIALNRDIGAMSMSDSSLFYHVKERYSTVDIKGTVPDDFILFPTQLEDDTSITVDSPAFKTMASVLGFILHNTSDFPIVVKMHPKSLKSPKETFETLVDNPRVHLVTDTPMYSLSKEAKFIIGINSTSIMESALHEYKYIQLGDSVFSNADPLVFKFSKALNFRIQKQISQYPVQKEFGKGLISYLVNNQIDVLDPQDWVIDKILSLNDTPRYK